MNEELLRNIDHKLDYIIAYINEQRANRGHDLTTDFIQNVIANMVSNNLNGHNS